MWVFSLGLVLPLLLFGRVEGTNVDTRLRKLNSHINFANHILSSLNDDNNKFSLSCRSDLYYYGTGLLSEQSWAIQMFHAGAKFLDTVVADLGAFDECLNISVKLPATREVLSKYCLGSLQFTRIFPETQSNRDSPFTNDSFEPKMPETRTFTVNGKMSVQFGICFPSACSSAELQQLYLNILQFSDTFCQTKASFEVKLDGGSIGVISFLGVIVWVMLLSTAYDVVIRYTNKDCQHPIFLAFSMLTNGKNLLAKSDGGSQISCLYGLRVISIMWIMLKHRYMVQNSFPMKNTADFLMFFQKASSTFVVEATVSVDTFLFMSGLLISYSYIRVVVEGGKFNILMYYIHRYLRLTPVLVVVMIIHITLLKHMGSGPMWPHTIQRHLVTGCEDYWWKTLLYVQNYGGQPTICISPSWYLSVDMQLFLLSPLLLIPMGKWPNITLSVTAFLTVCCIAICFMTGWFFELNHNILGSNSPEKAETFMEYYYLATQTRAAPWLIGIIVGYVLFQLKKKNRKIQINKAMVAVIWVGTFAVLCTCVFLGHNLVFGNYDRVANSFHMALVRPAWAAALGCIVFTCFAGYGGPINWFLSLPVFEVLSKLNYTMYLSHYAIIYMTTFQMRDAIRFSNSRMFYIFWGDFAIATVVAFLLTLAFEAPIITIEKVLLGGTKQKEIKPY